MNESSNVAAAFIVALNQLQSMKDKIDPEVMTLLHKSAHEAISSAHTFLDACEKAVDSLVELEEADERSFDDDVVDFKKAQNSK